MSLKSVADNAARARASSYVKARKGMIALRHEIHTSIPVLGARGKTAVSHSYAFVKVVQARLGKIHKYRTSDTGPAYTQYGPSNDYYLITNRTAEECAKIWAGEQGKVYETLEEARVAVRKYLNG